MKFILIFTISLIVSVGSALAECEMEGKGVYNVLGRFPLSVAHKSCLESYKTVYKNDKNLGDSSLYLKCTGARKRIAYVKKRQLFVKKVIVDGCE